MIGRKIEDASLSHGLILRALGNNLVFAPPFIITQSEITKIIEIVGLALDEVHNWYEGNS